MGTDAAQEHDLLEILRNFVVRILVDHALNDFQRFGHRCAVNDVTLSGAGHNLFVHFRSIVDLLIWLLLFLEQTLTMDIFGVPE